MSGKDVMPKLNLSDKSQQKLQPTELDFMKIIEKQNLARVQKLRRIRRNNLITAGILATGVFGIYGYSIFAVQQEKFLDDFKEPEKLTTNN